MNNFNAYCVIVACLWYYTLKYKLNAVRASNESLCALFLQPWLVALLLTLSSSVLLVLVGIEHAENYVCIETALFIHILGLMMDLTVGQSPGQGMLAAFVSLQFVLWDPQSPLAAEWTVMGMMLTSGYLLLLAYVLWSHFKTARYKPIRSTITTNTEISISDFML
jgi:hypothetical protein